MSWVLAVDGGNTKTLAAVADEPATTRGAGRSGTADIYNAATPDDALAAIEAAVSEALEGAGIDAPELDAAVFSLAGADWPEDFALLEGELLERLALPVAPLVRPDASATAASVFVLPPSTASTQPLTPSPPR